MPPIPKSLILVCSCFQDSRNSWLLQLRLLVLPRGEAGNECIQVGLAIFFGASCEMQLPRLLPLLFLRTITPNKLSKRRPQSKHKEAIELIAFIAQNALEKQTGERESLRHLFKRGLPDWRSLGSCLECIKSVQT